MVAFHVSVQIDKILNCPELWISHLWNEYNRASLWGSKNNIHTNPLETVKHCHISDITDIKVLEIM